MKRNRAAVTFILIPLLGIFAGIFIGARVTLYAQTTALNDYGRQQFYTEYTVRPGDTIWGIASDLSALNPEYNDIRQYVAAIEKMNGIKGRNLKAGETLLIPYFVSPDGTMDYNEIYSKYGIGGQYD